MALSTLWAAAPQVAADTYTSSIQANVNFGGLANLLVGAGNTSYVRFNLSTYASVTGADVSHAYIAGFARTVNTPGTVNICDSNGAWWESGLTLNTPPPTPVCTAGYTFSPTAANQWLVTEVTGLVQGWLTNPASNFGVTLQGVGNVNVIFYSKEATTTSHEFEL